MKKFYVVLFIIFSSSAAAFSQIRHQQANDDKSGGTNNVFAPAGEEFSIKACPVALAARSFSADNANRRYLAQSEDTYFYIFSDAAKKPVQYKVVLDFLKHYQPAGNDGGGSVDTENRIFGFSGTDGFFHKLLIVKTQKRTYVFQTVSRSESSEKTVRFFNNIQFSDIQVNIEPLAAQITDSAEKKVGETSTAAVEKNSQTDNKRIGRGDGNGGGTGSGSGIGSGSGSGNGGGGGSGIAASSDKAAPVIILGKPRASYTDFARFYEISGTVRLRVMFSASGKIGALAALTTLPFGLTEKALDAARAVRFSPATKNGQPFTTFKFVEYQFTIY